MEENGFWLGQLQDHLTTPGCDDGSDILRYEKALAAVTVKDIQQAAKTLLPRDRYVKVVLYPEKFDEKRRRQIAVIFLLVAPVDFTPNRGPPASLLRPLFISPIDPT